MFYSTKDGNTIGGRFERRNGLLNASVNVQHADRRTKERFSRVMN